MYYPYFRSKQYELITIRELAPVLANSGFCPIVEPVREAVSGLSRTLDTVSEQEARAIVIVNPHHGDLSGARLTELLRREWNLPGISAGILLKPDTTVDEAMSLYGVHAAHTPVFIHAGFIAPRDLVGRLGNSTTERTHVFLERFHPKLYQRRFQGATRVLLRDGFNRQTRNRDYPLLESFSDLHVTFRDEGMDGFGDFLIVGDEYSDSGGPAYAVAIHLTFIDPDQDGLMQIYHFKSKRRDTPKDPAGKFGEALEEMMREINKPESKVLETEAVQEFRLLHQQRHFPGLGYIKKLSMNHHIETLADYFDQVS